MLLLLLAGTGVQAPQPAGVRAYGRVSYALNQAGQVTYQLNQPSSTTITLTTTATATEE